MLKQLDTLIGFVVVMALVSLLVTIITQMISSLLGLRGKCLVDALEAMIFRIDSSIEKRSSLALIDAILMHPAVSDSVLPMKMPILSDGKWHPEWWQWLVKKWKRATAIRPEELLELLKEFGEDEPSTVNLESVRTAWAGADQALKTAETKFKEAAEKKDALQDVRSAREKLRKADVKYSALRILAKLNHVSNQSTEGLQALRNALPKLAEEKGATVIQELNDAANHALTNLTYWFDSIQDRASQWFTMHTRMVTIFGALAMALILQLDTLELFKQISSDKNLRNSLVKTAMQGKLSSLGDQVFTNTASIGVSNSDALYQQRLANLTNTLNVVLKTSSQDGLQLLPEPYPIQFNANGCWPPVKFVALWSWPLRHLFGIILSAGLLSLGAPFWFNLLKSLANLRSTLANEIDNDANKKSKPS